MPTRRRLHRAIAGAELQFDRRRSASVGRAIAIQAYRGFGREGKMLVRGRVLAERHITRATDAESLARNILNTYRRFQSDEIAGAPIRAMYRDAVVASVTDAEGFFQIRLESKVIDPDRLWHEVGLEVPEARASAVSHVMIPGPGAEFGIISDIDDTIVQTGATSLLRMARSVMENAAARLPFEGVADLYRALHRDQNPLFYVSSSPWNLYDLLHDFMELNAVPHGPMLLQDWGIDENTLLIAPHIEHKLAQIQNIVDFYPGMPFVLIGDSGQHDPEIYLRVIQAHPGRVLAVFIRDVTPDVRDRDVARIMEEAQTAGVEMMYVADSMQALAEARRLGLVS